jgi:hypothetical protein
MRKLLLATTALLALSALPAKADVVIKNSMSGTGDNVIFDSLNGTTALGSFNGQHTGFAEFHCLAGCTTFIGASNGNDIKISNFTDLNVRVLATDKTTQLATATDVFSLKGTGTAQAIVIANEVGGGTKTFTFDLGTLNNSESGFTLTAVNNETINSFRVVDSGGSVTDFEHYRIDIASPVTSVPEASTWAMMILGFLGVGTVAMRKRRREGHPFRLISA